MTEYYAAIENGDAVVLAVSADNLQGAETAAHEWGPPFAILYNSDASVIEEYGVLTNKIARPSTFIIDRNGIIRWKYLAEGKEDRPSPQTVLRQIQALGG